MTIQLYEKDTSDICEVFGLSNSGKSTYLKKIQKKKGKGNTVHLTGHSPAKRIFPFFKFIIFHPIIFVRLYYKLNTNWIIMNEIRFYEYFKIIIMRNSYLSAVLARYMEIRTEKETYVDEFFLQSIFMIYQIKAKKEEIRIVLDIIPLPSKILIFEVNNKTRYKRMNKNGFPGEMINKPYAIRWMKNSEYNFRIIKRLLLNKYKRKKMI